MTPERWQQIEQIWAAAMKRDAAERAAFLKEAVTAMRRGVVKWKAC